MAPPLQRAGSRGFLQTVLRVRTLIIGLFLCCVALMLFQTKLVTVTEELNSRLRREVATLSRTLAAPAGSEGCVDGPEPAVPPAADAARLRPRVSKLMRAQLDPAQPNLRQLLAEAPPLAAAAAPEPSARCRSRSTRTTPTHQTTTSSWMSSGARTGSVSRRATGSVSRRPPTRRRSSS